MILDILNKEHKFTYRSDNSCYFARIQNDIDISIYNTENGEWTALIRTYKTSTPNSSAKFWELKDVYDIPKSDSLYPCVRKIEEKLRSIKNLSPTHYVKTHLCGQVYVKEADFFVSQGGLTLDWGRTWQPIIASSMNDAIKRAIEMNK